MSSRDTWNEDYEFTVTVSHPWKQSNADTGEGGIDTSILEYEVSLPHQCDSWNVVGWDYTEQTDPDKAVAQMELFVKRAQEALVKLKAVITTGKPTDE